MMAQSLQAFTFDVLNESYRQVESRFKELHTPPIHAYPGFNQCEHRIAKICRKQESGRISFRKQCLICGVSVATLHKSDIPNPETLPQWSEELYLKKHEERRTASEEYFTSRKQKDEDFQEALATLFQRYHTAYMGTERWAGIRQFVLQRANRKCEGCGVRTASQIHHLTYERLGEEMLFDLVAVCRDYHSRIHHR